MKLTHLIIYMQSVLIVLTACTNRQSHSDGSISAETMVVQEDLVLPLDSMTSQQTPYMQLVNDSLLAFFNMPTYEICIYNIRSKNLHQKIKIYQEGPNAVNGCESFYYQNPDSIWMYAPWGGRIFLLDEQGNLKDKRIIGDKSFNSSYSVYPYPMTDAPYIVRNGNHFLQGMAGHTEDSKIKPAVSLIYNYSKDSVCLGNEYPEVYGDMTTLYDNWDVFAYLQTSYTLSPNGEIVTSFHVSDSIYVHNPETGMRKSYYCGYSGHKNIYKGIAGGTDATIQKFIESTQYGAVIYDRFRDRYYRIIRLPLKEYDQDKLRIEMLKKPLALIIMDGNFNIIGEYAMPEDKYYTSHIFVSPDGVNINVLSDDDDFLKFKVFKPVALQ